VPISMNIGSYAFEREILDRALMSANGVKVRPKENTQASATSMVFRFNSFRKAARRLTKEMYPEGDPKRGTTDYDTMVISKGEDVKGWYVKIAPSQARLGEVEVEDL
jgi:hypothetical protein